MSWSSLWLASVVELSTKEMIIARNEHVFIFQVLRLGFSVCTGESLGFSPDTHNVQTVTLRDLT